MDIIDIKYMDKLNKALEALNMVDLMAEYNEAVHAQLVTAYNDGYVKGKEVAKKELEENGESLDSEKITAIRNEAWDCLKLIVLSPKDGGLSMEELKDLFSTGNYEDILIDESITGEEVFNTIKAYLDEKAKKDTNNDMSLSLYKKQIVDHIDGIIHCAHALQAANSSWPSIAQCIIDKLNGLVIDINTDSI
jgi:hypothetical protein